MLEVVVEIDGRPLSRWGCDGVVMATPTGSTAYAFSAGGPVVWPEVEALLLVPISAHALFARPLVVSPDSVLAVEVLSTGQSAGVLWCDGRRIGRPAAGRADRGPPRRASGDARAAALGAVHRPAGGEVRPAGARLAGPARRAGFRPTLRVGSTAVLEEMRIRGLGVIEDAVLELAPGLTVVSGETGAGKTMVVTGLGLLFGGRADPGAVRPGCRDRLGRGPAAGRPGRAGRRRRRGGRRRARRRRPRRRCAPCPPPGGPGPTSAAAACPPASWPSSPTPAWPCTARATSPGCCSRPTSATPSTATPVPRSASRWPPTARPSTSCEPSVTELDELTRRARERAQEADLLRFGLDEIEAADPQPGETTGAAGRGGAARPRRRAACRHRAGPERAARRDRRRRRAGRRTPTSLVAGRPRCARAGRRAGPGPGRAGGPAARARLPAGRPRRRRRVLRRLGRDRPGPAGRGAGAAGRAVPAGPQVRRRGRPGCRPGRGRPGLGRSRPPPG